MVTITLPDGKALKFDRAVTGQQVAEKIGPGLAKAAIAVTINGEQKDLFVLIKKDAKVEILTFDSDEGKHILWHSGAHLFAQAVLRLFPKARITVGPTWEKGFFYDVAHEPFSEENIAALEKEMQKIVDEDFQVSRREVTKADVKKLFKDNKYKLELLEEMEEGKISLYTQGEFQDLCRGPHAPRTGMLKAFKLLRQSGAYWKGDQKNDQLQRVYGIVFPEKKQLKAFIDQQLEAEKRDHRKIGRELDLFSVHDEASGSPFFHPKGMIIYNTLIQFMRDEYFKRGYDEIGTPNLLHKSLWETSGHWEHYRETMYTLHVDGTDYAIKPMNCPASTIIFRNKLHSYRELPLRLADFGVLHRHELSGTLSGLFRVRRFVQDDAHIYCTPKQLKQEVKNLIDFYDYVYTLFGFEYKIELSTKPKKAMGSDEDWDRAEAVLDESLKELQLDFKMNEGDGAFYGPKIDFHIKDAIGRMWQLGTIQVDFQLPEQFDLEYEDSDGKRHRPVMIHKALLGSIERFMGILIEHYVGKFPLWLSPEQVRIIPVSDKFNSYGAQVLDQYRAAGIRATLDGRSETVSYKVRDAQLQQVNYILVVGEKEVHDKTVTVRTRNNEVRGAEKSESFLKQLQKELRDKK